MKSNELGKDFFNRSVLDVARDMLGLCLCKKDAGGQITRMIINETEAYDGKKTSLAMLRRAKLQEMK